MVAAHPVLPTLPASLAHLGALIGDPVRAAILVHLSDGSRRPAGELARLAGTSQQAVSAHLGRLLEGGLLRVEPQGRHRFFSLASGEVAETIEALANWLEGPRRIVPHHRGLQEARLCYDHLAGRLGVVLFDRMATLGFFTFDANGPALGDAGRSWCGRIGIALDLPPRGRRPLLKLCLDWTERRHHLGGRFGAALASHMLGADLIRRSAHPRALRLTARGLSFLEAELGLRMARDMAVPRRAADGEAPACEDGCAARL